MIKNKYWLIAIGTYESNEIHKRDKLIAKWAMVAIGEEI